MSSPLAFILFLHFQFFMWNKIKCLQEEIHAMIHYKHVKNFLVKTEIKSFHPNNLTLQLTSNLLKSFFYFFFRTSHSNKTLIE